MARSKTKYDLISRDVYNIEMEITNIWCWYDGSFDEDDHIFCGLECPICFPNFEYLPDEFQPTPVYYISKRGICGYKKYSLSAGKMIDMNSFYPKDVQRERKINSILGIDEKSNLTLEYILKSKK